MVSTAYLRQQAEILIAMSQATFDLGVAGRLRITASEFQNRAAEHCDRHGDRMMLLNGACHYLDLVPKGRDEDGLKFSMEWVRRHDQY
jgi:hypothetical protein